MVLKLIDDLDETLRLDHPHVVTFEEQQERFVLIIAITVLFCAMQRLIDARNRIAIVEARTEQRSPQDNLRNKVIEVRFTVPKVSLVLRNVLLGEKEMVIVMVHNQALSCIVESFRFVFSYTLQISLRGLAGQFVYRKFDMAVFVGLQSLSVRDRLQVTLSLFIFAILLPNPSFFPPSPFKKWGHEFRYLLTSKAMSLPIPNSARKATEGDRHTAKAHSGEKRTKPSESDLIKAYYFMIKEVKRLPNPVVLNCWLTSTGCSIRPSISEWIISSMLLQIHFISW